MKRSLVFLVTALTLTHCNIRDEGSESTAALPPSEAVRNATTPAPTPTPVPPTATNPVAEPNGPVQLLSLMPPGTEAGAPFNRQPDGNSAIAVTALNAVPGTKIIFDGRELATIYGNAQLLSAIVPNEMISEPRTVPIYLVKGTVRSNSLNFTITKKEGKP